MFSIIMFHLAWKGAGRSVNLIGPTPLIPFYFKINPFKLQQQLNI